MIKFIVKKATESLGRGTIVELDDNQYLQVRDSAGREHNLHVSQLVVLGNNIPQMLSNDAGPKTLKDQYIDDLRKLLRLKND